MITLENFDKEIMPNKWFRHYDILITRAQNRKPPSEYCELHHIIPKCLGGENTKENLVLLTAREHYIAHLLLSKIFPNHLGIITAILVMSSRLSEFSNSKNRTFSILRKQNIEIRKTLNKENCEWLAEVGRKNSQHLKGRTKETHEYLKIISNRYKGLSKETHEPFRKSSETQRGRTKETHEYLKINGERRKGLTKENTPFLQQISEKNNILPIEKRIEIQIKRKNGVSAMEIYRQLLSDGIDISYTSVVRISKKSEYKIIL